MLTLLALLSALPVGVQEPPPITLVGTVRVVDEPAGAPGEGWFDLWTNDSGAWRSKRVDVRAGRWETEVPPEVVKAQIGRMILDGREAHSVREDSVALFASSIELEARWIRETRVRIREAGGEELVMPVQALRSAGDFRPITFERSRVWSDAPPLVLPEWLIDGSGQPEFWAGRERWWVGAFGFAWSAIEVDHALGGDVWVELERAGELELELQPEGTIGNAWVELQRGSVSHGIGWWPCDEPEPSETEAMQDGVAVKFTFDEWAERRQRRFLFDRLPVGDYTVVVSRPIDCKSHELLRVPVHVDRDMVTRAPIALRAAELADVATCRGTLRVPAEWGELEPSVEIDARCGESWQSVERCVLSGYAQPLGAARVWTWTGGSRGSGSLRARIEPFQVVVPFEFDVDQPRETELVVPPPVRCELRVVDALSGAKLVPREVTWWGTDEPCTVGRTVAPTRDGSFAFVAPLGRIVVGGRSDGGTTGRAAFELHEGVNALELRMHRGHPVRVRLACDGQRIDVPVGWSLYALPAEGNGRVVEAKRDGDAIVLLLDQSGTYDVSWSTSAGYVGVAPVRVVVGGPEPATVELALTRIAR